MGQKSLPKEVQEKLTEVELLTLREHFQNLAQRENTNAVGLQTFNKYFLKNRPELSKMLWKAFDADRDGKVDEVDFIAGMTFCIKYSDEARRKLIFQMLDTANTGRVTVSDLKKFFPFPPPRQPGDLVQASWDFEKQHPKELGVSKGEILEVLYRHDQTWWLVKNKAGESGYVAAAYVKGIKAPPPKPEGWDVLVTDTKGTVTLEQFLSVAPTCAQLNEVIKEISKFSLSAPPAFELSGGPVNFRHQTHIGYDQNSGGFVFDSLPEEWKLLFEKAGVSSKDVADAETAVFLTNVVQQHIQKKGTEQGTTAPTTPPTATKTPQERFHPPPSDAPPPLILPPKEIPAESQKLIPERVQTQTQSPRAPQSPPPPPIDTPNPPGSGVPTAPPPPPKPQLPPPKLATTAGIGNLLEDIRKGKPLNKVNPTEINLKSASAQEVNDLASILKQAMILRQVNIGDEEQHESDSNWDD